MSGKLKSAPASINPYNMLHIHGRSFQCKKCSMLPVRYLMLGLDARMVMANHRCGEMAQLGAVGLTKAVRVVRPLCRAATSSPVVHLAN